MSNITQVLQNMKKAKIKLVGELENNVLAAGLHVEGEIAERTPVSPGKDGGVLAASIIAGEVEKKGTKLFIEVGTNIDYAVHVEYGVTAKTKTGKTRKNPYDYHKGTRIFKSGTGARMFRDTMEIEQENIIDIIKHGG